MANGDRILVIKHSALGDLALAFGPMQAIRDAHPDANITLLTTKPFEALGWQCGLFDDVWLDERPPLMRIGSALRLRSKIKSAQFRRVYDLQTSSRTAAYFRLLGPSRRPEWSGTVKGCSHPHRDPARDSMHLVDAQAGQLADAGISKTPISDLSWWQSDVGHLSLPANYGVLLPGGAAHRPGKRWPVEGFGQVAQRMARKGIVPVVVGGPPEATEAAFIVEAESSALNLIGKTNLMDLAPLMRGSVIAIGNDTGPMHVAALVGTPCVVLFGPESNPDLNRPRAQPDGIEPRILRAQDLRELPVDTVWKEVSDILFTTQALPSTGH